MKPYTSYSETTCLTSAILQIEYEEASVLFPVKQAGGVCFRHGSGAKSNNHFR